MKSRPAITVALIAATLILTGVPTRGWAQTKSAGDQPANNMAIVHEKLKADKKLIVAKYMDLTESEAKNFWPVYEEYQNDLQKIYERVGSLLQSYAADYRSQSLTDEKAKTLSFPDSDRCLPSHSCRRPQSWIFTIRQCSSGSPRWSKNECQVCSART